MSDEQHNPNPLEEPSVLDYVKSLLRFGRGAPIQLPEFAEEEQEVQPGESTPSKPSDLQPSTPFPWRSLLSLFFALIGQGMFEPPHDPASSSVILGIFFYVISIFFLAWAVFIDEWKLAHPAPDAEHSDPQTYRRFSLVIGIALSISAFLTFTDNLFTWFNVTMWLFAIAAFLVAFWVPGSTNHPSLWQRVGKFINRDPWQFNINISRWTLLLIAASAVVLFFRFYHTATVPPEPFSDQAEKILDVYDVTQGQTHIFFTRNTGREGFQMYWTVLIAWFFGTGLSFLSLKLGTAILGALTLPYVYLLGKEIGEKRVGLFALIFTGIGYWPNVISRVGLRFPLYPLFVAPTLLYLIRGLRTRNRNDFLLSGFFLGLGLHGYSPFRFMPFVVIVAFALYFIHSQSQGARRHIPLWFGTLVLISAAVFLPLLRYWKDNPTAFGFRAISRLTGSETPITQPIWKIFLSNLWNALRMFNYDDGGIWVHSVTNRPALDTISAALFLLGVILVFVRYVRNRHWVDLFLLISIPLLLMPSILSLAFPGENPALNRAGGAIIPVFLVAAMALDGLLTSFGSGKTRTVLVWIVTGGLILWSGLQNYDLVFNRYYTDFRNASWNTSEMGALIKRFGQTYGTTDTAWVVPFPYWVDTRLPGVWAGIPNRDFAMWRDELPGTVQLPGPKLFIVKANEQDPAGNDQQTVDVLRTLYPDGQLTLHKSDIIGHDFWVFFVPR